MILRQLVPACAAQFITALWLFSGLTAAGAFVGSCPNGGGSDDPIVEDDFSSQSPLDIWWILENYPEVFQAEQVNGRLELPSTNTGEYDAVALYVANEWQIDLNEDFAMRIDYRTDMPAGDIEAGVVMGVLLAGEPSIEGIEAAIYAFSGNCQASQCSKDSILFHGYVAFIDDEDDEFFEEVYVPTSQITGTMFMWFDATLDIFYISFDEYGDPGAFQIPGMRAGAGSDEAVVFFGGYSELYTTPFSGSDMWLDNFALDCGTILTKPTCAPADLNCDGVVNVTDLLVLFDNWGNCGDCGNCPADLNGDCVVNVSDLLMLFNSWG